MSHLVDTNVTGYLPASYFGDTLREARLTATTAQATVEKTVCTAVTHIKGLLNGANLLMGTREAYRKALSLPRNYRMVLDTNSLHGSYVLYRENYRIADEWKAYNCSEEALDQFILDLGSGLLEDVAALIASAATLDKKRLGASDAPQKLCELVEVQGTLMPLQTGWDYEAATRLDDGTLVVPRERTLLCPPAEENFLLSAWSQPYSWSPRDVPELSEQVLEIRMALGHKDNRTWLGFLHGDTLLPQFIDDYDSSEDDNGNTDQASVHSGIEWAMSEADEVEFEIEKGWAARGARANINQAVRGKGE